jgi:Putative inner membrane protein (DUF1819)
VDNFKKPYPKKVQSISHSERYALSFTTGALLYQESVNLATLFIELDNWSLVREVAVEKNLLQMRTSKSSVRLCQEICSRLKTLNNNELKLLVAGTVQDRGHILWLALCRRYKFIQDFAVEVLREKLLSFQTELDYEDFEIFFSKKAEWHTELDALKLVTKAKARGILFKMLREADLLSAENRINPTMLSPFFLDAIGSEKRDEVVFFPVLEY